VNESFARRYLAPQDPIGRRVFMVEHDAEFTVVGVVRDVPPVRPGDEVRPQIFWSNRQLPRYATYFLVRTAGEPAAVARAIEARLHAYDPEMQVSAVRTMRDWLAAGLTRPRFGMTLLVTFGLLALGLSVVGTYSLLAYSVARRTKEIGIRMALGAGRATVMAAVLGRGMRLAAIGVALGVVGALAATRLLHGMLAGIGPRDPLTFAAIVLLLLATAAVACLIPARRASRVDPMKAIRAD